MRILRGRERSPQLQRTSTNLRGMRNLVDDGTPIWYHNEVVARTTIPALRRAASRERMPNPRRHSNDRHVELHWSLS
jgi:hypothetical protein